MKSAKGANKSTITNILNPYLEGIEARLNALNEVQMVTESFLNTFNDFFFDKDVSFNVSSGLQIKTKEGVLLEPSVLSSGEQQLLLLFCYTIISRDNPSIFIIDEPELSLNVKWQRRIIKSLLDLVAGSEMQFFFATHSLELITQYRKNVERLNP